MTRLGRSGTSLSIVVNSYKSPQQFAALAEPSVQVVQHVGRVAPGRAERLRHGRNLHLQLYAAGFLGNDHPSLAQRVRDQPGIGALEEIRGLMMGILLVAVEPLRELRERYVAHRNFEDALGRSVKPTPEPAHTDAQAAIDALDAFLHAIDHKFTEREAMLYEHLDVRGGSGSLLWFLRRGLKARDDDFAARRPPMRFDD